MQLPYIQNTRRITSKPLLFSGLNRKQIIDDSELSGGKNLNTETLPALSPRKKDVQVSGNYAGVKEYISIVNDKLIVLSTQTIVNMVFDPQLGYSVPEYTYNVNFYFDGGKKGEFSTPGVKSLVDFNGKIVIFPQKIYYDYSTNAFGNFTCPYDIDFTTVHYNRIFGVKGNNIYASKLGEYNVWDDYSGTELDSWATDVEGHGDFTGITTYQDHVVFFKRNQMFELYGYTPSQFRVLEVNKVGCLSHKAIIEVAGVLYFVGEEGVYAYSGGVPRLISDKLNLGNIIAPALGTDGRKLFFSYFEGVTPSTYVFDTQLNTWLPHKDGNGITQFTRGTTKVYYLSYSQVYELETSSDYESWEAVTKEYDEGIFNKLSLKSIKLKLRLDPGSEVEIFVKLDGKEWVQHKIIKEPETSYNPLREVLTTIPMKRSTTYQIMLRGQGRALVWGEREYYIGSEKA